MCRGERGEKFLISYFFFFFPKFLRGKLAGLVECLGREVMILGIWNQEVLVPNSLSPSQVQQLFSHPLLAFFGK